MRQRILQELDLDRLVQFQPSITYFLNIHQHLQHYPRNRNEGL